jgi:hypothetical protein
MSDRIIKRFSPADVPLRPWRIKKGTSHPWIVESATNIPGHFADLASFGYKPFAELVSAAPELVELIELVDTVLTDLRTSNPGFLRHLTLQDYGRYNDLIDRLQHLRRNTTPDILRLPSRKKEAA